MRLDVDHGRHASIREWRRAAGVVRIAGLWLILALMGAAAPAAASPLPKLALTVPGPPGLKASLAALDRCLSSGTGSVVAPVVEFRFGGSSHDVIDAGAAAGVAAGVPAGRRVLLHVRLVMADDAAAERLAEAALGQQVADAVAALPLAAESVQGVIVEVAGVPRETARLQFLVAALVLKLKATRPAIQVTVAFPPGLVLAERDLVKRITAYADLVGLAYGTDWRREADWVRTDLGKPVALRVGADAAALEGSPAGALLRVAIESSDADVDTLWIAEATPEQSAALCRSYGLVSSQLKTGFSGAPIAKAPLSLTTDGGAVAAAVYIDSSTPDLAYLVRAGGTMEQPRVLSVTGPADAAFTLTCLDALDGHALTVTKGPAGGKTAAQSCTAKGVFAILSIQRGGAGQLLNESVNVVGRGGMRVEEIVARWQQYRETQRVRLENSSATCVLSLHFEATAIGTGIDLALQLRVFAGRNGQRDWVQDALFVNGVRFKNAGAFPLPQLEPEKVVTDPLELKLEEKYRYTLLGTATIGDAVTYVVGIEPESPGTLLYSGKVWIDGMTFRQVRMQLQQAGGKSNVQTSVETQDFDVITGPDGQPYNVLVRNYAQQITNTAGRSFLVEKTYKFSNYQINSATFDQTLTAARASDIRMFRDTPEGLRVLRNDKGQRVIEEKKTKVKSLIIGAIYQGSYSFPIPMLGYSFVDFDFKKTGAQLSVLFAGPYLAANLSKQLGQKFRVSAEMSLSAVPSKNRVFVGSTELTGENVWDFYQSTGVLANWQATSNLGIGVSAYLDAEYFGRTAETAPEFNGRGHGYTLETVAETKFVLKGFSLLANATHGQRFGWSALGVPGGPSVLAGRTWTKYSGEIGKQFYVGKFNKIGATVSYFGGSGLDRFSRYQPSFLSRPRIHGIPGGTDQFDQVAVASATYAFNVMEAVKIEAMYNRAWAQTRIESRGFKAFEGLEVSVGTVGPWSTLVQASVTYALRGNIDRYKSRWGVYLLVLKPLGK